VHNLVFEQYDFSSFVEDIGLFCSVKMQASKALEIVGLNTFANLDGEVILGATPTD
jgi:hypothetical protein